MKKKIRSLLHRVLPLGVVLLLSGGRAQAQAANDDCALAAPVTVTTSACSAPVNGTVEGATQAAAPGSFCSGTTTIANDVWYSFVPTSSSVQIILSPRFAAAMELHSGTCASSTLLGCTSVATSNTNPRQYVGLTSGQTYLIRIYPSTTTPPPAGISSTFTLCIGAGATTPPANDECTNAVPLPIAATCATPVNGTLLLATQSLAPSASCRNTTTSANDVWYSFVATGTSQNITFTAAFLTYFEVRQGTCASSSSVFCSAASSGQTTTINGLTNGQAYFLRVYSDGLLPTTDPNFILCLTNGPAPPANDECSNAIALAVRSNCQTTLTGTVAGATQSVGPTAGCNIGSSTGTTVANDVWYSFVATGSSQTINATGQLLSFVLDIRTGTCANSTSVFCDRIGSAALVPTGLTAGQTYFIRIYPNSSYPQLPGQTTFTLCLNDGPSASANDECSTAVAVAVVADCTNSTNGTVYNATPSLPASASCGGVVTAANDIWYSFVATGPTQTIALSTHFPAVLEIRSGTCASTTPVFCATRNAQDDAFIANGLMTGQPYFIRIYPTGTPTLTNATFTLCLTTAPTPPANDECAGAVLVPVTATCAAPISGTVAAATQSLPSVGAGCAPGLAQDVWYRFVATATSHLVTLASVSNFAVDVRSGTCAASTSVSCGLLGSVVPTRLITGLTVGQTYYIRVYGSNFIQPSAAANFTLCITTPPTTAPANDDCAGAIPLTINAVCTPVTGNVTAATQSLPPTTACGGGTGTVADVWYSFVAASSGQDITLNSVQTPFIMEVRSGTCATSSSLVCGTTLQLLQATGLMVGQTYYIRVYAPAFFPVPTGSGAVFNLCLTGAPANDDPCGAVALPLTAAGIPLQPITSTTFGATTSTQPIVLPPTCNPLTGIRDVWFSFTPGMGVTSVRLAFSGTGASVARLFTTSNCANGPLTQIGCGFGLSNVVLTGLVPGQQYYLAVSDNGFSSTPGPFTIAGAAIVTATRAQADTEALVVFPNPSNTGQLTLRLSGNSGSSQATLLNALGQAVLRQALPGGTTEPTLSTRGLASGVYTLRVVVGNAVLTRKVVLE